MKKISLPAQERTLTGKKVKQLRHKGLIPGVVYGHIDKPQPVTLVSKEFRRVYGEAGTGSLVDLDVEGSGSLKVLIHEPQIHHLTGEPIHADFYAVKMDEEIETTIPVHFIGSSPAVEELEGNFIANKDELTVRCLPGNLIPHVEVDISALKTFEDQIRVEDIAVPETVKIMDDPEEVVALVSAPRSEEELEAELAEDKAAEEAAVEELGKTEGEPETTEEGGEKSAEDVITQEKTEE